MRQFKIAGLVLLELDADGAKLVSEQAALDLMGEIYGQDIDMIVVPVARLPDTFFKLATGLAGAIAQKFTNYGLKVAFVGDISAYLAQSRPLQDFVRETNKRKHIVFATELAELEAILSK